MRLASVTPIGIPHVARCDTSLGKKSIYLYIHVILNPLTGIITLEFVCMCKKGKKNKKKTKKLLNRSLKGKKEKMIGLG